MQQKFEICDEDQDIYKPAFFIAGHPKIKPQLSWTLKNGSTPGLMTCACDGMRIFDDIKIVSNSIASDLEGATDVTFFELGSGGLLGSYSVVSKILEMVPSIEVVRLVLSDAGYAQNYHGHYLIKGDPVEFEDVCIIPELDDAGKFIFEKWSASDDPLRIPFKPLSSIEAKSYFSFPLQDAFISEFIQRLQLKIPSHIHTFQLDLVGHITPHSMFDKDKKDALVEFVQPPSHGHFVYYTVHMEFFQTQMLHKLFTKRLLPCSSHHVIDKASRLYKPIAFLLPTTVLSLYALRKHYLGTQAESWQSRLDSWLYNFKNS